MLVKIKNKIKKSKKKENIVCWLESMRNVKSKNKKDGGRKCRVEELIKKAVKKKKKINL